MAGLGGQINLFPTDSNEQLILLYRDLECTLNLLANSNEQLILFYRDLYCKLNLFLANSFDWLILFQRNLDGRFGQSD